MKIKILYVRKWNFTNEQGDDISGYTYGGKKESGGGITFTSGNVYAKGEMVDLELVEKWDEVKSVTKYSEAGSF